MAKLEIKNLSAEVNGKVVVNDVSLAISSGEVHVLMGPNGSGKSSLLNVILGHPRYALSGGTIALDGEDITNMPTYKKARKGLFLSQQILPGVEGVTLATFLREAHHHIKNATTSVLEFYKYLEARANLVGISTSFLKRFVNAGLSGGEKKQSEVLQLMVLQPQFAFLDEIDSGVDIDSLKKVFAGIELLKKEGTGFLLVTHYTKIFQHIAPERVHIMKDGAIIASGGRELIKKIEEKGFQ
ncbi:MAG: Fe-S cluster assembly ATPase SufC [Patescibacteria group bacterium]|nr:Fe-S cluster assembly ATPase SufC [Patescibacteria group bacterium]